METTIAKVGYAMITETTDEITYDNIVWFKSDEAGGREISAEPSGDTIKIYADGQPVIQAVGNSGYEITLILISIIDKIETDWFNKTKLEDGSILEIAEIKASPKFALVVAKELLGSTNKYAIDTYFYCSASNRPSKKSKTSEGNFDPEFPEFSIAANPRPDNQFVCVTNYANELPTTVTVPTVTAKINALSKKEVIKSGT